MTTQQTLVLAHHNSETGEVSIYADDTKQVLFQTVDEMYIGKEGIRRFHLLHNGFRKAQDAGVAAASLRAARSLTEIAQRITG